MAPRVPLKYVYIIDADTVKNERNKMMRGTWTN